ncbi:hypothetical protein WN51_07498 [Melipona quadrifasciata]|uniref:Uncharacterized protein n=1 Tax=Melipona quadrifasciata TaxID=166423 RepID=A0A0M9A777_9HYME|nr:hypothetical protein WN51_07498 [Melipona quadrifasciata]
MLVKSCTLPAAASSTGDLERMLREIFSVTGLLSVQMSEQTSWHSAENNA